MKCLTLANKIEAMKNLMLHHIASLLYHFITSGAQLWLTLPLYHFITSGAQLWLTLPLYHFITSGAQLWLTLPLIRNSHCSDRKIVAV
jgi:hypothetical protein